VPPADRTYLAQLVAAKAGIPLDHGNGRIRFASIGKRVRRDSQRVGVILLL
jgi:hypothetical protein